MAEVLTDRGGWLSLGVFIGNAVGCALAVFCLIRIGDTRRTVGNRVILLVAAAWALVETARDDMLFVSGTAVHWTGYQVRFLLVPSLVLTVIALVSIMAVLTILARYPRPLWTVVGGAAIGLLVGGMTVQAAVAARPGVPVSVDRLDVTLVVGGLAVVTAVTTRLTVGSSGRATMAVATTILAGCLTAAQYLVAGEVTTDSAATGGENPAGVSSATLIIIAGLTLALRTIVLAVLSVTDTSRFVPVAAAPAVGKG